MAICALASNEAVSQLGEPYYRIQSFITGDKIYCVHVTENEEVIRKHARLSKFPINTIAKVKTVIDTLTANRL
ncbi:MAG: nickel-binding protein [Ginsengibacter sp.]